MQDLYNDESVHIYDQQPEIADKTGAQAYYRCNRHGRNHRIEILTPNVAFTTMVSSKKVSALKCAL